MQAHHIIEDIKKQRRQIPKDHKLNKLLKNLADGIRSSHKFHFGEVNNFLSMFHADENDFAFMTDSENLIFPYHVCLFEYDHKYIGEDGMNRAALLVACDNDFKEFEIFAFEKNLEETQNRWLLNPAGAYVKIGENFPGEGTSNLRIIKCWNPAVEAGHKFDFEGWFAEHFFHKIWFTHFAVLMLTCPDVKIIDIKPALKLQQARKKRRKVPLFTYKTLVIDPSKKAVADPESKQIWQNRLHFVRRHKKHYTAERPLFGKVTGDIICPAHVRGNKKLGFVMKDYAIQAGGKVYDA